MLSKTKATYKREDLKRHIKDFNNLIEMDLDDYKNDNIDIDKLLFNANCRTWELNKLVHNLKVSK